MEPKFENNIENKESVPTVETVRAAVFYRGKFLVLQKDKNSKNPGALEFPGGKIDVIEGDESTLDEQKESVLSEVKQETKIDIDQMPIEEIDNYGTYFEVLINGLITKHKRIVHLFLVRIPDEQEIYPKVNETKNEAGESEDKHKGYIWVSPEELISSTTLLKENPDTGEQAYLLARNSRHIKKLLQVTGYLKEAETVTKPTKKHKKLVTQKSE